MGSLLFTRGIEVPGVVRSENLSIAPFIHLFSNPFVVSLDQHIPEMLRRKGTGMANFDAITTNPSPDIHVVP